MSKTFLTQCPHCSTRFRVNSNQLFAAQGAVRCGSCMQVFNARLFLEQDPGAPPAQPSPPKPAPELDTLKIHDDMDLDLDSPDFEQELARLAQQEAAESRPLPDENFSVFPEHDIEDDELPAVHCDDDVESEDFSALEEEHSFIAPPVYPTALVADADEPDFLTTDSAQRHEPELDIDEFAAIDDEPLQLEWQPERRNKGAWLWSLLCLLAALGLAVQYSYYNFNELARQPGTRPWLEAACTVLPCNVPERVDVSLVTSSNLVVRPHADFANALSVDAIIYNRAGFSQPFPLLQLNFMDDNQKLLASRSFQPREYLGGELAGSSSMPAQTPIRIALDVLVPDARATSYNLKFLSPE